MRGGAPGAAVEGRSIFTLCTRSGGESEGEGADSEGRGGAAPRPRAAPPRGRRREVLGGTRSRKEPVKNPSAASPSFPFCPRGGRSLWERVGGGRRRRGSRGGAGSRPPSCCLSSAWSWSRPSTTGAKRSSSEACRVALSRSRSSPSSGMGSSSRCPQGHAVVGDIAQAKYGECAQGSTSSTPSWVLLWARFLSSWMTGLGWWLPRPKGTSSWSGGRQGGRLLRRFGRSVVLSAWPALGDLLPADGVLHPGQRPQDRARAP